MRTSVGDDFTGVITFHIGFLCREGGGGRRGVFEGKGLLRGSDDRYVVVVGCGECDARGLHDLIIKPRNTSQICPLRYMK